MKIPEKIKIRMDELQSMMENDVHLTNPDLVEMQIESVSRFWSVLSEEDQDYIHCAEFALEDRISWKR